MQIILPVLCLVSVFAGGDNFASLREQLGRSHDRQDLNDGQLRDMHKNSEEGVMVLAQMAQAIVDADYSKIRELVNQDGRGFLTNAYVKDQIDYDDIASNLEKWKKDSYFEIADGYTFFDYVVTDKHVLPEFLRGNQAAQLKLQLLIEEVKQGDKQFEEMQKKSNDFLEQVLDAISQEVPDGPQIKLVGDKLVVDEGSSSERFEDDANFDPVDLSDEPRLYKRGRYDSHGNPGVRAIHKTFRTGHRCTDEFRGGVKAIFRGIKDALLTLIRLGYGILVLSFAVIVFLIMLVTLNGLALLTCVPLIAVGAIGSAVTTCTCGCIDCGARCVTCNHYTAWTYVTKLFRSPFNRCVEAGCAGILYAWSTPLEYYANTVRNTFSMIFYGNKRYSTTPHTPFRAHYKSTRYEPDWGYDAVRRAQDEVLAEPNVKAPPRHSW